MSQWRDTLFLRTQERGERGWLLDVMACVDRLGAEFTLEDVYQHESYLAERHPANLHVKDKVRQQLQVLRDKGYLEFLGR